MPNESKVPVLHCPTCYSTKFQLSKSRREDRLRLLIFQQPVRCRKCNTRIYASRTYARWLRKQEDLQAEQTTTRLSSTKGMAK